MAPVFAVGTKTVDENQSGGAGRGRRGMTGSIVKTEGLEGP